MKASLKFDPNEYDYGPASEAVRSILFDWGAIDWFEPTTALDDDLVRIFQTHSVLAHRATPELVAERVNVRVVSGGWSEFDAWSKRVREQKWDWKFSVLKKILFEHSKANGWRLEDQVRHVAFGQPKPGDLFFRFSETALVWNGFLSTPDLRAAADGAQFYFSHVQSDAIAAIEWQLAEKHDDASRNPFVPLLQCYRAGGYPFSLDRDTVVVFRFL